MIGNCEKNSRILKIKIFRKNTKLYKIAWKSEEKNSRKKNFREISPNFQRIEKMENQKIENSRILFQFCWNWIKIKKSPEIHWKLILKKKIQKKRKLIFWILNFQKKKEKKTESSPNSHHFVGVFSDRLTRRKHCTTPHETNPIISNFANFLVENGEIGEKKMRGKNNWLALYCTDNKGKNSKKKKLKKNFYFYCFKFYQFDFCHTHIFSIILIFFLNNKFSWKKAILTRLSFQFQTIFSKISGISLSKAVPDFSFEFLQKITTFMDFS